MTEHSPNTQRERVLLAAMMGGMRNLGDLHESRESYVTVDDVIRAAKVSGIELTDSDVVAIACAL